jgi:shikimate kinase
MASGKTTVGRELAERLGWEHVDLDAEIERGTGRTIAEIFASEGEAAFRRLEKAFTPRLLERDRAVLSPGGGWITHPGLFDRLPPDTLTVWLKVSPTEVLARLSRGSDQPVRPLLQSADPASRIAELLALREPLYRRARLAIDTEGRPVAEIAREIEAVVRGSARKPSQPEAKS